MTTKDHFVQKLGTYDVAGDGICFRMNFVCQDGGQISLTIPTECLEVLIMTLPQIMRQALRARYHDESLRLVYSADTIKIEYSSDPKTVIVTFATADGFEASFSLSREQMATFEDAANAVRRSVGVKSEFFN